MAYTILRFKKDKGGAIAGCERHNERKKEAYKSNPDIDMNKSKENYHPRLGWRDSLGGDAFARNHTGYAEDTL